MLRLGVAFVVAFTALASLAAAPSAAAKRVALVIGNATYQVGPLANSVNDATAVAKVLETLEFDKVLLRTNAGAEAMKSALSEIAREAVGAEIALVFYAGHGTEREGRNYLIPVDAKLERASDLELQAISLPTVIDQISSATRLKLVILDACRNNVFPLAGSKRATSRGLARIEPEDNTLVVYAAKEGTTADDGTGTSNSPFTQSLLKHIATPGLEVNFVFRRIRDDVMRATSGGQQPHMYGTLGGEPVYLRPASPSEAASGTAPVGQQALLAVPEKAAPANPQGILLNPGEHLMDALAEAADWDKAVALAAQVSSSDPYYREAQTTLGVAEYKAGNLDAAERHFTASGIGPVGTVTNLLLNAWLKQLRGDTSAALEMLNAPTQPEWAQFYLRYHRALISDIAGRHPEARTAYERLFKQDSTGLRLALAYARHAAQGGDLKLARSVIKKQIDASKSEAHVLALDTLARLDAGEPLPLLVESTGAGIADALYQIGEALSAGGEMKQGVAFLQMALHVSPQHEFALAALAAAHESEKRYAAALSAYDRIDKASPLQPAVEVRRAYILNSMDKPDAARDVLVALLEPGRPIGDVDKISALDALGSIMRSRKRYGEAVQAYDRLIPLLGKSEPSHWTYYYSRGTSHERLNDWAKAEPDLRRALSLAPDQPMILNYLGYSLVDQGLDLKPALAMIEKAVSLKPSDGYIVDSLGWAHFRIGNYKEALRHLTRAVELLPNDPTLVDHLGDALWRTGRAEEARAKWKRVIELTEANGAGDLVPETIKAKIASGLAP